MVARRLQPGDAFWAPDKFHDDDPELKLGKGRPWLVLSNDKFPGQTEKRQYLCCALTSNLAPAPAMIPLRGSAKGAGDWEVGGGAKDRQIDTETVQTIKHEWIGDYLGRAAYPKVRQARKAVRGWLE